MLCWDASRESTGKEKHYSTGDKSICRGTPIAYNHGGHASVLGGNQPQEMHLAKTGYNSRVTKPQLQPAGFGEGGGTRTEVVGVLCSLLAGPKKRGEF